MVTNQMYAKMVKEASPNSKTVKNLVLAFLIGGAICMLGQGFLWFYKEYAGIEESAAAILTSASLIAVTAVLTGLGVFDTIAKYAGAGTLVPITGFANSMVSPALEFKSEGMILGIGAKMFLIAGPVIVYGVAASAVYGLLLWLMGV